jgi:hypothetical protein
MAVPDLALFLQFLLLFGLARCSTVVAGAAPTGRVASTAATSANTGIILVRVSPLLLSTPYSFICYSSFFSRLELDVVAFVVKN